ncbi:aminotransferase class V-fold PLP-dependent enzyme [Amycolatopsis rhizosphaerae]|uniref:Aminotransferase class V-fold PLP-dependent enzyme n=1 Tax=Amycolatopsis rhizosphaerae TaxID=2053003 RepID=A0A558BM14_9PSEU|nr:aminotransferase class V-fold PLP-dependent enzyme [Amycolatopsis rhizosphaerae]TVT37540.1 aminotransferase class V-fold PLP-dependent enzyme [Amycolatopsis rhizosphaerae]
MRAEDVRRFRDETPGCAEVIHFNNAGSSLPPAPVTDTVLGYLRDEARQGGYEAADAAADRISAAYTSTARLLGAADDDIAFTDSATRSWQAVFYALRLGPGDRILTCRSEYASNAIAYLQSGADVEVVDDDENGQVDVADLARRIDDRVKLISMNHVPTHGGLVNPAEEVGAVAGEAGIPFLLDACQAIGQLDLDVTRLRCDALTGTGRKYLRGPRGTGLLYVHPRLRERLEPAMLDLHSATWTSPTTYRVEASAKRFEAWERSQALLLGLGAAVDYALAIGLPAIEERVTALAERLRADLGQVPGVTVHDQGKRRCGIVTFTVEGVPSGQVKQRLGEARINTSVTNRTSAQYDFSSRSLPELVRASVHYYNTDEEIRALVEEVDRLR